MEQIHATCVAIDHKAVLLRGPSGAGKSDLALRLIDRGGVLVADDRVDLRPRDGVLVASPPARLAGLMEVRGIGILRFEHMESANVGLVVDLISRDETPRLPDPANVEIAGVTVPHFRLDPFEASAPIKVALALANPSGGILEA